MRRPFKIAAVQACPAYMDREATIAKASGLIAEVGVAGAELAVFPEAFVPGYPLWVWFIPAGHTHPLREVYASSWQTPWLFLATRRPNSARRRKRLGLPSLSASTR